MSSSNRTVHLKVVFTSFLLPNLNILTPVTVRDQMPVVKRERSFRKFEQRLVNRKVRLTIPHVCGKLRSAAAVSVTKHRTEACPAFPTRVLSLPVPYHRLIPTCRSLAPARQRGAMRKARVAANAERTQPRTAPPPPAPPPFAPSDTPRQNDGLEKRNN